MQSTFESGLVYFLHIPKTSGTSLYQSFLRVYGEEAASPNLFWDDLVNGTYQLSERQQIITGHLGGLLPLWLKRWPTIVTILREPLGRALSHINQVQRNREHPLHALAAGLTVTQYCEIPILRRTVDNFQARYLASLDFALALMPRPTEHSGKEPYGSVSISFENALHSLDKESGLLDGAVRALNAIDVVGICEAHGTSLRVFARALGWDVETVEFGLNQASGQRTLRDLSRAELDTLRSLNLIDIQVYGRAVEKFFRHCSQYDIELNESERSACIQRGVPVAGDSSGEPGWGAREAELRSSGAPKLNRPRLIGRLREFAGSFSGRTQNVATSSRLQVKE